MRECLSITSHTLDQTRVTGSLQTTPFDVTIKEMLGLGISKNSSIQRK